MVYTQTSGLGLKNTLTLTLPNECPAMTLNNLNGEVPVMLELWGMWSTPLMPSLPGLHWHGAVSHDGVLSMGQIELN